MQMSGGLMYPLALLALVIAVVLGAVVLTLLRGLPVKAIFREFSPERIIVLLACFGILIFSFGANGGNLRATFWQALLYFIVAFTPLVVGACLYVTMFRRWYPPFLKGDRTGAPKRVVWAANIVLFTGLLIGAILGEWFRR
jgi:hypothetical protein